MKDALEEMTTDRLSLKIAIYYMTMTEGNKFGNVLKKEKVLQVDPKDLIDCKN